MIYCFDIDGTICSYADGAYEQAVPYPRRIEHINRLFADGHTIFFYSSRSAAAGVDSSAVTRQQLENWQVRYHQLFMGKPAADFYIGNTCRNVQEWETQDCGSRKNHKIGIMHGRLSAPTDGKFQSYPKYTWKEEFSKAAECGLDLIEWIFEADEWEKNQFATQAGLEQIKLACI